MKPVIRKKNTIHPWSSKGTLGATWECFERTTGTFIDESIFNEKSGRGFCPKSAYFHYLSNKTNLRF